MRQLLASPRASAAAFALAIAGALLPAGAQTPAPAAASSRNVYAAGGEVRPAGPVAGDYTAVGGRVLVDQPISGDAMLAGGAVEVRAPVGEDVRAGGGDITIDSTVGGELFAAGANVSVRRGTTVAGMASLHGANVTVEGRIDGGLRANGQKITLNGEVRGDVRLAGEEIELGPQARIGGALSYASGRELKKAEGATVAGAVTREARGPRPRERAAQAAAAQGVFWAGGVFSYFALLACAALLLLVVPGLAARAPQRLRSAPWLALAIGFATVLAVPVLAVLLFITLLGIPLGIVVMMLYPVLLLAGFLVGVLFIAQLLAAALRKPVPASYRAQIGYFAVALLLVLLVARVPFLGGLLLGLVSLGGLGAGVLEVYRRGRGPGTPAAREPSGVGEDTGKGAVPTVLS